MSVRICVAGVFLRHPGDRCFERVEVGLRSKLHFFRRSSTMQMLFLHGCNEKHARNAPEQSRQL